MSRTGGRVEPNGGRVFRPGRTAWRSREASTVAILVAEILFAMVWLKAFRIGPMEWLWRALIYGRLPQLKKAPEALPQQV